MFRKVQEGTPSAGSFYRGVFLSPKTIAARQSEWPEGKEPGSNLEATWNAPTTPLV